MHPAVYIYAYKKYKEKKVIEKVKQIKKAMKSLQMKKMGIFIVERNIMRI